MFDSKLTKTEGRLIVVIFGIALIVSGLAPADRFTWFLEIFPALIGLGVLLGTRRIFQFSRATYWLLLLHSIVLMIGGHYTYAKVPLFDWIGHAFGWQRNNYDKLGHFFQGFVPAIAAQELLIRAVKISSRAWVRIITILSCLGISAAYELFEWGVAVGTGAQAEAFLGTQGYIWDTQSDMLWALIGSCVAVGVLSKMAKGTKS